jgi:hypothetical protein
MIRIEVPSGIDALTLRVRSGRSLPRSRFLEHPHDVALLHDEVFDPVQLDLGAGPFPEEHPVADLEVDWYELARLVAASGADGDDLALLRFFLCGIRDDDAAGGFFLGIDALDDDTEIGKTRMCSRASFEKFGTPQGGLLNI